MQAGKIFVARHYPRLIEAKGLAVLGSAPSLQVNPDAGMPGDGA